MKTREISGWFVGLCLVLLAGVVWAKMQSDGPPRLQGVNEHLVTELDPFVRTGKYPPPPKYNAQVVHATLGDKTFGNPGAMTAYRTATNYVSEQLKAPSTAHFSPIEKSGVKFDAGHIRVSGYVDSQNSFGAMLRSKYTIWMRGDLAMGEVSVEAFQMDED